MTTSSGIRVRILGDDSDLQNKLRSSTTAIAKWGAAAAAAAAAGGAALVRAGMQSADEQAKLARQLNTTVDALQRTTRASELAGVSTSQLESATRNLNDRLGQAISQGGPAADALDRIGLSAQEVADLPLDERIEAINTALVNNVSAAERASVASDLYGRRAGMAMSQIDADTIAEATRQIDRFGGALSDVDAAQIEAANDAISQGGQAFQAVTQQLAVQFAPVLQGIVQEMEKASDETDFFGNIAERAFDVVMKGAGFAGDAIRGLQVVIRGIQVALRGVQVGALASFKAVVDGWDDAQESISEGINRLIANLNRIPGVNIDELVPERSAVADRLDDMLQGARRQLGDAAADLHELLMQPLPSEGLNDWVDQVKEAAERAARETVEAREGLGIPEMPEGESGDPEADAKRQEELDKLQEQMEDRLHIIERGLLDQRDLEIAEHQERMDELRQMEEAGLIDEERIRQARESAAEQHQDRMTAIDRAGVTARLNLLSDGLGNMATLMQTENRKLFEIGKVAAIAQATVDGYQATISAYRVGSGIGGPVVGAAFAATAATATGVQIAKLASTSYGSGSGSVSAPPAGSSTVPDTQTGGQQGGQGQQQAQLIDLSLQGDNFSREGVLSLMEQFNEAIGDGAVLRVTG